MTLLRLLLPALVSTGLALVPSAQVEHGGEPPSRRGGLRTPVPTARLTPVRADLLLAEDAAMAAAGKGPLRFAEVLPVELGLTSAGVWEELPDGGRVWRLRIHSPGARSLALVFGRYQLPPGAELFVHDDARETLRGAYTEHENRFDGEFAMRPLRGDALTLEYVEPAAARGRGELELALVAHDYRDVIGILEGTDRTGGGGVASSCELDVACPLGATWGNAIDSTVHIQSLSSGLLCSGTLLNNTAGDGSVLLLSSYHCGGLTTAVYSFNFQRPACRDGVAPCNQITGATLLARNETLDVQLMRLNLPQAPQPFPVYLSGWDRTDTVPDEVTVIHHPAGDVKKISRDFDPPVIFQDFWRIRDWDRGVTEGGSSGGGTYDLAGRCIGILDSGSSFCQVPTNDDFSVRLSRAWPVLEPYLDPLGTGLTVLDGLDLGSVTPQPFAVTGVHPAQVDTVVPTTSRVLRILGNGFRDGAQILVDDVPLDDLYWRRGGHAFFNLDLPPTPVGPHTLTIVDGVNRGTVAIDVVHCTTPTFQAMNGFEGEFVFSLVGIDGYFADVPGHVHACLWSLSNVPSLSRRLDLAIGNNFTDLRGCLMPAIPASGFTTNHYNLRQSRFPFNTPMYGQVVCLSHGVPYHTSGVQTLRFQF
ncbi:MAG TPA: hypothetical protein VF530_22785 [Planctomycetota bacterium]